MTIDRTHLADAPSPAAGASKGQMVPVAPRLPDTLTSYVAAPAGAAKAPAQSTALDFILGALRGRYLLVIVLGLIAGSLAGAWGWWRARPVYQSEALLQIAYSLPTADGDGKILPMFPMFMASQKTLITSRRAIDAAIQDPIWRATGRPVPAHPEQYFASNLTVDIRGGSEFIRIVVTDEDPGTAAAAVTAIVNAYTDLYKSQEERWGATQRGLLDASKSRLKADIKTLTASIDAESKDYGTSNLDVFYEAASSHLTKLEAALFDLRLAIATVTRAGGARGAGPATAPVVASAPAEVKTAGSPEEIAAVDPATRKYLDEQERLENEVARMTSRYGAAYPNLAALKEELQRVKAKLTRQMEVYVRVQALTGHGPGVVPIAGKSLDALLADQASLMEIHREAKDELVKLGNRRRSLNRMVADLATLEKDLGRVEDQLGQVEKQKGVGSRLTLISTGEIPLSPIRDPRLKLAAAGALAGGVMPAGLILAMSFVWRRYRYADEAEVDATANNVPLLGILPELKGSGGSREDMLAAAHSIHQVRLSLTARAAPGELNTFMVTSGTAGEGKTSLTVALGLSFAVARFRTLVIDADLVGRQLTEHFAARGEEGFHEALGGSGVRNRIRPSGANPNLHILPAGKVSDEDAYGLSAGRVRTLLAEARSMFDVVLIDTGPILGSVEAGVLAAEVDGVVIVVSQGQRRQLVEMAVRRLGSLGARVVGMIFNRAKRQDYHRSAYGSSSIRSVYTSGGENGGGSLVAATASAMPAGAAS